MKYLLILFCSIPLFLFAQNDSVSSPKTWEEFEKMEISEYDCPNNMLQPNHLLPLESFLTDYPGAVKYRQVLKYYLYMDGFSYPDIQFIGQPSFSSEYIYQIKADTIIYKMLKKGSVWHYTYKPIFKKNKNIAEIKTLIKDSLEFERKIVLIDDKDKQLLKKLYLAALAQTRYNTYPPEVLEHCLLMGNDGRTFTFSLEHNGFLSGKVWSPREKINPEMYQLVKINKQIISLIIKAKSYNKISFPKEIRMNIRNLINNLLFNQKSQNTINEVKQEILAILNKDLNFNALKKISEYPYDNFIYILKNGYVVKIELQEPYEFDDDDEKSDIRDYKREYRKLIKAYLKALKSHDFASKFNVDLNVRIYLDITLTDGKLVLDER